MKYGQRRPKSQRTDKSEKQKLCRENCSNAKGKLNMAKIDTKSIEGFDAMTAEEKLNALLGYEFEAPKADESAELTRVRNALNKASSECADYKKQLRERQTEAEREAADRLERENALQEELKAYKNRERISTNKAKFMSVGYDAETAETLANALPEGVSDDFFAVQKSYLDQQKQTLLSEALNRQPKPSVGVPPTISEAEKAEMANLRRYIGLK